MCSIKYDEKFPRITFFPLDTILYNCLILQLPLVFLLKIQKPILLAIIFI